MGVIRNQGSLSGRNYGFRIAGDTPTVDEQREFDARVQAAERAFATQYQERFGENIEPQGRFVGEVFRGLGSGLAGLAESGALGLASALPQSWEDPTREAIRGVGYAAQKRLAPYANYEDSITRKLSEGVGSTLPFFALAPFGPGGIAAGAALGAAAGAGEASERAYAGDATEEQRGTSALLGAGVGLSEIAVPVALRGLFGSLLRAGVPETTILARLKRIGFAASAEGAQEAAAEFLQNAIEQGVYNPEQDLAEGLLPAAGVGGGVGAIIQGLVELGTRTRGSRIDGAPATPPGGPLLLPPPTAEERVATPPVIRVPPTDDTQRRDQPGANVPPYPATPTPAATPPTAAPAPAPAPAATPPTAAPAPAPAATPPTAAPAPAAAPAGVPSASVPTEFNIPATVDALRDAGGNYVAAASALGIKYPELQQRVRHLESIGVVSFDSASGQMVFSDTVAPAAEPAAEPTVEPAAEPAVEPPVTSVAPPLEFIRTLDELQVPRSTPVYKQVQSGRVVDKDAFDTGLRAYAEKLKAGNPRRAAIEEFLSQPPAQEVQDAPAGSDLAGLGASAEDSVSQPRVEGEPPTTASTPSADDSVGQGLGALAPSPEPADGAAPAQPDTVTPEVPAPTLGAQRAAPPSPTSSPVTGDVLPPSTPTPQLPTAQEQQVEAELAAQQEVQTQAKAAVATWFEQNADPETKAANDALRAAGDADTTAFRPADAAPVLALLNGPAPTGTAQKNLDPAAMAHRYFSRYRDPGLALSAMANDAAEAAAHERHMADRRKEGFDKAQEGLFGPPTFTAANLAGVAGGENITLSPEDRLMVGLGRNPGKRAMEWAQANLSPETRADLISLMERPARTDRPGYGWINFFERAAVRDRIKGKRAGTRGTVDEILPPETPSGAEQRAAREAADRRREEWQALTPEQRRIRQLRGDFSFAWPLTAHPHVGALIRAGDFVGGVRTLAMTAPTRHLRRLAAKLLPRLQSTRSRAVPTADLARIRDTLSPETPTLGMGPSAVYIWPMPADAIQQLRNNGHNEAADIAAEYGGQVVFDEAVPMSAELVLHEAVHVAADGVLTNPSHPLTRRLENLRKDLLKTMPATEYGLLNVRELLSEGMTNPAFRRDLTYLNTDGTTRTAWQRFKDIMHGFLRSLMGLPPRGPDGPRTARDLLDQTFDDILALNPMDASSGDVIGGSFKFIQGARDTLDTFRDRARVPTAQDAADMRRMVADTSIPAGWKNTFMSLFMPLRYVQDGAKDYLSSAPEVGDLIAEHKSAREKIENTVKSSGKFVEDLVRPHMRDDKQMELLTRVVYEPQEFEIDARVQDGNTRYSKDEEKLAAWRRYNSMWNQMNPDMQKAANAIWGMQKNIVRPALQKGVQASLEAIAPGKKPLTDRIFKDVYKKLYAETSDIPYAPLSRQGTFWLSYGARDPQTGQFKYYKQSFVTAEQRAAAIRKLEALNTAASSAGNPAVITELNPYRSIPGANVRPKESLDTIARILATIDGFGEMTRVTDPVTGEVKDVRQDIINMVFDSLPESSFVQSFRQRKFTPGYDGDFTPLTEGVVPGDVVGNSLKSALARSQQAVDLEYGAKFSALRNQLRQEFNTYQRGVPAGKDPVQHARDVDTASVYLNQLLEGTRAPFMQRGALSGALTGGAYILTLGLNASSALLTLSSLPLFASSVLAGRHSMLDITSAMGSAHRLLTASGKYRQAERINGQGEVEAFTQNVGMFNFSGRNYDANQPQNRWMAVAQRIGDKNAVFYNSQVHDVLLGENPNLVQKLAGHSSILQHTAERYSREVSYWSAYLLELHRLAGRPIPFNQFVEGVRNGTIQPAEDMQAEAAKNAVELADRANGPMFAAAGPAMSRGDIGSVMYLFKRHPLSMLNLMLQTAYKSTPWGTQDAAERRVFQRQAIAMYGMMGLMAGVMGLPLMQQIGWLYDLFADDDEPSFDAQMRIWLGEGGARGLVNYLTGLNVAERIGLGDAIYRPNSLADQLPPMWRFAEGIGGPVVGLAGKYTQRVPDLLNQGEYWRAAEAVMPTAFGNILRAARFGEEGVLTMRGDPILSDVGPYSVLAQGMGFMSAEYAQQLAINAERTRISNAINTQKSRLLQQLNRAKNDNDWERQREIRERIQEFNRRNPDNKITRETERRSMRGYLQTRAQMEYGVNITPANRKRIDDMLKYGGAWAGDM